MTRIDPGNYLACNEESERCCIFDPSIKQGNCISNINVKKIREDSTISVNKLAIQGQEILKVESKDPERAIDCQSEKKRLVCRFVD